ncbi:hypothetical protein CAEBREN_07495 [Caenorhabditis brenneri]|uniref:Uncharacterized protein n=1 Tax=Caenorhabditis brenneri TaxID=135651 RepID=G0NEL3_CAEBE|nr:hypothetical protein CAEBREN_07495 [Caenorhabditis brenneri]
MPLFRTSVFNPEYLEDFWQYLPFDFKLLVVNELDHRTRCWLAKCSREDHELVSKVPLKLEYYEIHIFIDLRIIYDGHQENYEKTLRYTEAGAPETVKNFKHPKSFVRYFDINAFGYSNEKVTEEIVQDLVDQLQAAKVTIRTFRLRFHMSWFKNDDLLVKLIECLEPVTLKRLCLTHKITGQTIAKLAKTEQWKHLEKIGFGEIGQPDFDSFLHLERMRFEATTMSSREVWKMVQSYTNRDLPIGSYFDISIYEGINVDEVLDVLEFEGITLENRPVRLGDEDRFHHTQRILCRRAPNVELKRFNKMLVLKMATYKVYGFIAIA